MDEFQNTNPERGRKHVLDRRVDVQDARRLISEHEPRKGTETVEFCAGTCDIPLSISEHDPRKGTETE